LKLKHDADRFQTVVSIRSPLHRDARDRREKQAVDQTPLPQESAGFVEGGAGKGVIENKQRKAPTHNKRRKVWEWANGMNGPRYTWYRAELITREEE
jgi:hypothetical protein